MDPGGRCHWSQNVEFVCQWSPGIIPVEIWNLKSKIAIAPPPKHQNIKIRFEVKCHFKPLKVTSVKYRRPCFRRVPMSCFDGAASEMSCVLKVREFENVGLKKFHVHTF